MMFVFYIIILSLVMLLLSLGCLIFACYKNWDFLCTGQKVSYDTSHQNLPTLTQNTTNNYDGNRSNLSSHLSSNVDSFIRNRNAARLSEINYISPNSAYGYLPKTNILNERNKHKEVKKECTVKLSPFPAQTRNMLSPNLSIASPKEDKPTNHSLATNNCTPLNGLPENKASPPRMTSKRPMTSSDPNDDLYFKKSRNFFDTIDLEDSEMFEIETTPKEPISNKKATKRSTFSLDSDAQLNSPLKRVKNNEIFSSYSSTASNTQNLLNKRKYSPEDPSANTKVKKRTYIEELELLASDSSPYYKNIYNTKPDLPPKNTSGGILSENIKSNQNISREFSTSSPLQNSESQLQSKTNNLAEELDEDEDSQDIILDDDSVEDEEPEQILEPLYPIPSHVFSIKDHEYDKKKSKNRLNQFLAAIQQGSEKNNSIPPEAGTDKTNTANFEQTANSPNATSSFETKPTLVGLLNESSSIPKSTAQPLTTTIVLADTNDSNKNNSFAKLVTNEPKPTLPSLATPVSNLSTSNATTFTTSTTLTPINPISTFKVATTSANSNSLGIPISNSISVAPTTKIEPSMSFNFSSMNSNSLFPTSNASSTFSQAFANTNNFSTNTSTLQTTPATLAVSKADNATIKPVSQVPFSGFNLPTSTNLTFGTKSSVLPSSTLATVPSNPQIASTHFSSVQSFPSMPSLTSPQTMKPFNFSSELSNKPVSTNPANQFNFGQASQQSVISSKPSFDFSQVKNTALNSTSLPSFSLPTFPPTPITTLSSLPMNGSASNFSLSNSSNNSTMKTTSALSFAKSNPPISASSSSFNFNAPNVSFNFSGAPTQNSNTKKENGFNFAASAVTFTARSASTTNALPNATGAPPVFPSLNANSPFTFGASNPSKPMFQFGK